MNQAYNKFKQNALNAFGGQDDVPDELLNLYIQTNSVFFPTVNKDDLFLDLRKKLNEYYEGAKFLESSDTKKNKKWLRERRSEGMEQHFWERYATYLKTKKNPIDPRQVDYIDKDTDEILTRLGDPTSETSFSAKGLVVGNVQSGKTSNFIGLINKAADAGYKIIIVFAGLHNNLRSQTQFRIDEGFVGVDSKEREHAIKGVGVHKIPVSAISLTTSEEDGDFSTTSAKKYSPSILNTNNTVIFCCKKNWTNIQALIGWLNKCSSSLDVSNFPALIIDDEADNASINTQKQKEEVSKTNKLLRKLLKIFNKKSYLGYTATPFANIFIPFVEEDENEFLELEQDLFPEDFIATLNPPPNYIGAKQFFGFDPEPESDLASDVYDRIPEECVISISDHTTVFPHPIKNAPLPDHWEQLPKSLLRAIKHFILVCAIRYVRGQETEHNSMLVHVALYTTWQTKIKELIEVVVNNYRGNIKDKINGNHLREELKQIYFNEFLPITRNVKENFKAYNDSQIVEVDWEDVDRALEKVTSEIKLEVKEVHGKTKDILDYEDYRSTGINVIAVGGNKLSRGLTLEGLSVSYYLRSAGTYDTLMQMGRWFGYRPGYLDLCRLYISSDLTSKFRYVTLASEELRSDFRYLWETNGSPRDFGWKVRTHSSGLQVTAANKRSKAQIVEISFSNRLKETYRLSVAKNIIENNLEAAGNLISTLGNPELLNKQKYVYWENVDADKVLSFFNEFEDKEEETGKISTKLIDYTNDRIASNELLKWDVVFINNNSGRKIESHILPSLSVRIGMTIRTAIKDFTWYEISNAHIISKEHEWVDLQYKHPESYNDALRDTVKAWEESDTKKKKKPKDPSGHWVRKARAKHNKALLLIYLLDPEGAKQFNLDKDTPIVGYAVSFPESKSVSSVKYLVRKDYVNTLLAGEDNEE